ncbi:serine hydrolase domain-containing protein [Nocardioides sp. NPDC000445]|uniref:serine hydrolase domain-containing protein n=1 Tax=Nocardioides sp. NPDC000445 TaxID=3154257 RepID=UPI0033302799
MEPTRLESALEDLHRAGMPGAVAEVRDGDDVWRHAAGVADLTSRRPMRTDLRHRVGSVTKSFTAAAVLQQVERGVIELDHPIGDYLPGLVPGEPGRHITVRMLINHTSGLREYLPYAYPSLAAFPGVARTTPDSLEDNRRRTFDPHELIKLGVEAPPTGRPGSEPGVYSNTNYLLLGQLLEEVGGLPAEQLIARDVIAPAGLEHTRFPSGLSVSGPHSRLYESWFGMFDPPRDFSVFDMSWVGVSAALVSTVADLDRFFARLLAGEVIGLPMLAEMQRTVPVIAFDGTLIDYGLGLHRREVPGVGTFWGHDGSVWGGGALSLTSSDGRRQVSLVVNRQRWNTLGADGRPQPHPIDQALEAFVRLALGS